MIKSKFDKFFDVVLYFIMAIIVFACLFPIWYVFVASFSAGEAVSTGKVLFWIKDFSPDAYITVFSMKTIWSSYANTIFYSFFGTAVNMILTVLGAYALSKKHLPGRKILTLFILMSMWFSPGMMANYINYRELHMINSRWAMLLIGAVNPFNLVLMRSFFESIPVSLEESAVLEGADDFTILLQIFLPLSKAALMTISLYYFVAHWNSYFWSMILLQDESKIPLQVVLKKLVVQMSGMYSEQSNMDYTVTTRETFVYATMIVAILPMIVIYPFVQKFFVKGVMIGAVKG